MNFDREVSADKNDGVDASQAEEAVRLASWVTLKRTKSVMGSGAYGTRGIVVLTDTKLIFLAAGRTAWEIERAKIANVKRPRWAVGSYVTFDVGGSFYGLAFGGRGMPSLVSASDLAIRFGGTLGVATGVFGDAVAVAAMRKTSKVTKQWFEQLSQGT
jgi:hypothetical protein